MQKIKEIIVVEGKDDTKKFYGQSMQTRLKLTGLLCRLQILSDLKSYNKSEA